MRALLDVSVLIALLDAGHMHHGLAARWLEAEIGDGWASCPITQNGCIRIMSQPAYPGPLPTADVAIRLAEAALSSDHAFWPDEVNLLEAGAVDWLRILGHRQITDVYLLALAVRNGGRFVSLDRRVNTEAVPSARPESLVTLTQFF